MSTLGLWHHFFHPIHFTLIVDNFGIKFVGKSHANHLIKSLCQYYKVEVDWTGSRYAGIHLNWDFKNQHVNILMSGFVTNKLKQYDHK